jgi:hypothetical protein
MAKTVAELISLLESEAGLPASSARWTEAELVDIFNKSLSQQVLPDLIRINEEYGLTKKIVALTTQNGTLLYPSGIVPIPSRSYGETVRNIAYQRSADGEPYTTLPYIEINQTASFLTANRNFSTDVPAGFHFYNRNIKLVGNILNISGKLHYWFVLQPSTLVNSSTIAVNLSNAVFNTAADVLRLVVLTSAIGADLNSYLPNTGIKMLDVVHPATGAVQGWNLLATRTDGVGLNGTGTGTYTKFEVAGDGAEIVANFATDLSNQQEGGLPIAAGMSPSLVVLPAGQSNFSTVAPEFDNFLLLDVAKRVWASLGDMEKAQAFSDLYKETMERVSAAIGDRSKGQPKQILNRTGMMQNLMIRRFGFRF